MNSTSGMKEWKKYIKTRKELNEIFILYSNQPWLMDRENSFIELFLLCGSIEEKQLVFELLNEFHFLEEKTLDVFLTSIADFIINESGFEENKTQITALTFNEEADSSQKFLDYIKMYLHKQGWNKFKTVNSFKASIEYFGKGRTQMLFIDEFIGSGKTMLGRLRYLKEKLKQDVDLKICFIAGIDLAIKKIEDLGYEVFCPLRLPRGISDIYVDDELELKIELMLSLEKKLAQKINEKEFSNYSFGYGKAEALYSLEGQRGNTPNSVFPIFWWPRLLDGKSRNTLLNRFENGIE